MIHILFHALDARMTRPKDPVPKPSLLAIVVTFSPPIAMVKVMILDDKLRIEQLEQPVDGRRRATVESETAMSNELRKSDILETYPPLVETHGHTHDFHRGICEKWNAGDIHKLLFMVCVGGEQGVGMLR